VNKLIPFREIIDEAKKRYRKLPKINDGDEGSDDIDEPSDVREEWIIIDKHKNAVISKHGDDQKGATIAARKMDFGEWNKTHKLGRFCPMATHGPGAMAPDVANLEPGGKPKPKKKAASNAKPAAKATAKKPAAKAAPAAKKSTPAKAKAKTPGQGGGLGTQIGALIAKHMGKMFKEETEINEIYYTKRDPLPNADAWKEKNKEKSIKSAENYMRKFSDNKPKGGMSKTSPATSPTPSSEPAPSNTHPNNIPSAGGSEEIRRHRMDRAHQYLAIRHARTVGKTIDPSKYNYHAQRVLGGVSQSKSPPPGKIDYPKAARELAAKQRYAKLQGAANKKPSFLQRHPIATAVGGYVGRKVLSAAKKTLFASVNDQIERLLFETEECPNYHVQILMSKGVVGDKSFRRHSLDTVRPIYTGAPNEPIDTKWLNNLITRDEQIQQYRHEGYAIEDIVGSHDSHASERQMNERHSHMVRVNDAIRRKFTPKEGF
jgi:hypothetical protein